MGRPIPPSIYKDIHEIPEGVLKTCRFFDIDTEIIDDYIDTMREQYGFIIKDICKIPEMTRVTLKNWKVLPYHTETPIVVPVRTRYEVYKLGKYYDCLISELIHITDEYCVLDKKEKILYHFPCFIRLT